MVIHPRNVSVPIFNTIFRAETDQIDNMLKTTMLYGTPIMPTICMLEYLYIQLAVVLQMLLKSC